MATQNENKSGKSQKSSKYTPLKLLGDWSYGKAYLVKENNTNVILKLNPKFFLLQS